MPENLIAISEQSNGFIAQFPSLFFTEYLKSFDDFGIYFYFLKCLYCHLFLYLFVTYFYEIFVDTKVGLHYKTLAIYLG